MPDFRGETSGKIGIQLETCSVFQGFKEGFFRLSMNDTNTPHSTILTQNKPSDRKIEPENYKNYVFEQILNHSLSFEPFPSLISGLNSKFFATLCVFN